MTVVRPSAHPLWLCPSLSGRLWGPISPEQDGMPEAKWAKLRLAQLHAINKDKGAAQDLLASIDVTDDENLEDEVKKLKKRIKKMR